MSKQTIEEKLHSRKIRKPNFLLYWFLMLVIRIWNLSVNTHFTYRKSPKKEKGPFVLIATMLPDVTISLLPLSVFQTD